MNKKLNAKSTFSSHCGNNKLKSHSIKGTFYLIP